MPQTQSTEVAQVAQAAGGSVWVAWVCILLTDPSAQARLPLHSTSHESVLQALTQHRVDCSVLRALRAEHGNKCDTEGVRDSCGAGP